jgi:hypothetical protein
VLLKNKPPTFRARDRNLLNFLYSFIEFFFVGFAEDEEKSFSMMHVDKSFLFEIEFSEINSE